ncbi:hypothetical protein BKA56DRAFT_285866 [Ilyonectria sp. MPI-CAGE-AT-0026]|nr:hypothetical protein BKA56DRAFT_285866 [Ilyonectria sp. MPI-CAGE-AT-0026]
MYQVRQRELKQVHRSYLGPYPEKEPTSATVEPTSAARFRKPQPNIPSTSASTSAESPPAPWKSTDQAPHPLVATPLRPTGAPSTPGRTAARCVHGWACSGLATVNPPPRPPQEAILKTATLPWLPLQVPPSQSPIPISRPLLSLNLSSHTSSSALHPHERERLLLVLLFILHLLSGQQNERASHSLPRRSFYFVASPVLFCRSHPVHAAWNDPTDLFWTLVLRPPDHQDPNPRPKGPPDAEQQTPTSRFRHRLAPPATLIAIATLVLSFVST